MLHFCFVALFLWAAHGFASVFICSLFSTTNNITQAIWKVLGDIWEWVA